LFFFFYLLRLVENFYLQGIDIVPGPGTIFPVFILNAILPSFVLSYFRSELHDRDFMLAVVVLISIFLLGLTLNLDSLIQTADSRLTLERANPIVLANTSIAFLQFQALFFRKSNLVKITTLLTAPFLLLVVVLSQSRGPWLAAVAALVFFVILIPGRRKVIALFILIIVGVLTVTFGSEYIDIVTQRFLFTDINGDESTYLHYVAAGGAWKQFQNDPFFGRYAIELITGFYPHNIFLEVPMAVGLLGGVPFFIHFGFALTASIGVVRNANSSLLAKFVAITFVRECIVNAFAGAIWGATSYWICSFVVIMMWFGRRRQKVP
jgi:O-antigen ligase